MSYQIETGIPLPRETDEELLSTLHRLKVGQSILVSDKSMHRITPLIIRFNEEHDTRRELFWSEVGSAFRIWRTK